MRWKKVEWFLVFITFGIAFVSIKQNAMSDFISCLFVLPNQLITILHQICLSTVHKLWKFIITKTKYWSIIFIWQQIKFQKINWFLWRRWNLIVFRFYFYLKIWVIFEWKTMRRKNCMPINCYIHESNQNLNRYQTYQFDILYFIHENMFEYLLW